MSVDLKKYSKFRTILLDNLKKDLMGPVCPEEALEESPLSSYITGILSPQDVDVDPEEVDDVMEDFTSNEVPLMRRDLAEEEDESEETSDKKGFKQQSSIGITFYIDAEYTDLNITARWGEYARTELEREVEANEEEVKPKKKKASKKMVYMRIPREESLSVDLSKNTGGYSKELCDGVLVKVIQYRIKGKSGRMVSVFLSNIRRSNNSHDFENTMFQVELEVTETGKNHAFLPEYENRSIGKDEEDYYYSQRPVFARGYGCAATWDAPQGNKASSVRTTFIPDHEISAVSTVLEGIDPALFSMKYFSVPSNRADIVKRLRLITEKYGEWIEKLRQYPFMDDENYKPFGNEVIKKCQYAHERINRGISLIESDNEVFDAFLFVNQVMYLQWSMKKYADKHGKGITCSLEDFLKDDHSSWFPFQIAYILLNLEGCINPASPDRETVDLLFFPTGGGKTEAYLGLTAFTIAYRRLTAHRCADFEKDGGVTVILRYTLRLLTTQQRDRLLKMICAAEMMRQRYKGKYGSKPISIGFWVGGSVTPNDFSEFILKRDDDPRKVENAINRLARQIIICPCCGTKLTKEDYDIDTDAEEVIIKCSYKGCYFNKNRLPVYLVDDEIYRKCPTVIISTVDKFARLPWDEKTGLLFGNVRRYCERHGYIAVGEEHSSRHNKTTKHPAAAICNSRPFYPPELIIQDELHLITGPLGTIYGGYETAIEELCSVQINGKKHVPKYIVSTATIKNADAQIKCLYGREKFFQFPPKGFVAGDSYFVKEIDLEQKPFRMYAGICASGQSMKTTLLRTYAALLQTVEQYKDDPEFADFLDPYYSLVGYFNSIRELGGTVRLLSDDIPKRIHRIRRKYGHALERRFLKYKEITSRVPSYLIPDLLELLNTDIKSKDCLDVAIATNMIAVGMDIDRLGLMVVTGQPKQSAEYIQATSRIGRKLPGLVITVFNPYRPRDLSHYENFVGYHSQLYRYVEGTTATPFSARARDRVLHAVVVSLLRLRNEVMAGNRGASSIQSISDDIINEARKIIVERVSRISASNISDTEAEINTFIDDWKKLSNEEKTLYYYIFNTDKGNRLLNFYDKFPAPKEKPTLNSMREVENTASLYYYQGGTI